MWASSSDDQVSREPFCDHLKVKKRKIGITREVIQPFLSKQMRLVDVAKDLGGKFSSTKYIFLHLSNINSQITQDYNRSL